MNLNWKIYACTTHFVCAHWWVWSVSEKKRDVQFICQCSVWLHLAWLECWAKLINICVKFDLCIHCMCSSTTAVSHTYTHTIEPCSHLSSHLFKFEKSHRPKHQHQTQLRWNHKTFASTRTRIHTTNQCKNAFNFCCFCTYPTEQ